MQPQIWMTGDAVVDLIPDGQYHYQKCPGGAPANVAVAVSRLGVSTGFFGRVGNDPLGHFIKQVLIDEQVDTQHLTLDAERRTSTVLVDLDDQGERTFTFMVKPSADQFTMPEGVPAFQAGQWLHTCSIALANEPTRSTTLQAMKAMKDVGGYLSFDPNLRPEVWACEHDILPVVREALALADVVKFSAEELCYLSGMTSIEVAMDWLHTHYQLPVTVVTQGKAGALVQLVDPATAQPHRFNVPGMSVAVVDTTGAGDAFVGGMLAGLIGKDQWLSQACIEQAIRQANGCGALAVTAKGAMTALPDAKQLAALL
ncbi:aminoimidazole riboside kinase [uncultured Endozoicomonas sp.]|uniref:aminoimidazole riboside kinase n=1 Tax=uncultured Endozoicomonas sp. TaxID=432652 RepID=UPI00262E5C92|nr:aminoimidazole riboside kinase [uncultured Endozoicomonas sp.]